MPLTPRDMLPEIVAAVEAAGAMVAAEFCRPGGPRFSDHVTAPVDHEAEMLLRDRLTRLLPARFVGEEAGVLDAPADSFPGGFPGASAGWSIRMTAPAPSWKAAGAVPSPWHCCVRGLR